MPLILSAPALPLRLDATGVVRIGSTRVTLETVVAAFQAGATPEEIVTQYPSLQLADIYAVIAYYLQRRAEVDAYLAERQHEAEGIRQQIEGRFDPTGVRERLLARRPAPTEGHDPVPGG